MRNAMKRGFTLVEMLVTLILLGILVAVVFPVVTQQIDDADPTKAANDLANIRTAIEVFHLNVRPAYPADIEDLANIIEASTDTYLSSASTTLSIYDSGHVGQWNGPYIDKSFALTSTGSGDAIKTGFSGQIQYGLVQYDATNDEVWTGTPDVQLFVAVRIDDLNVAQAGKIDQLIDGSTNATTGQLRYDSTNGSPVYYLAVPLK